MKIKCARTNQIGNISTQFFLLSNSSLPSLYFCCFLLHFRNSAWHNPLAFSRPIFPLSPIKRLSFLLCLLFYSCPQRILLPLHRNLFHLLSIYLLSCHFLCLHLIPYPSLLHCPLIIHFREFHLLFKATVKVFALFSAQFQ